MSLLFILILIAFLAGFYFIYACNDPTYFESLTNMASTRCPNILIQKGARFFLYNSTLAEIPGVNPIEFENLEDYVEFINWQRSQGIRCPVLYLQHSYDAQGQAVYKVRPSVTEPQGGLPPAPSTQYNPNYSAPPTMNQPTSTSELSNSAPVNEEEQTANMLFSPNAMDDNWGGPRYTKGLVDAGFYEGNEVNIYVP